jgi:hypothetical protein
LRVKIIALGSAALAIAAFCAGWLHLVTISRPSVPPSPELTAAPAPHLRRLNYHMDTTRGNELIAIVNQEPYAWNDVHVAISEGDESFQCPALPTVGSGHTLTIQTVFCRSPDGRVPMHVCVVRVTAEEGGIASGLEPCVLVK